MIADREKTGRKLRRRQGSGPHWAEGRVCLVVAGSLRPCDSIGHLPLIFTSTGSAHILCSAP